MTAAWSNCSTFETRGARASSTATGPTTATSGTWSHVSYCQKLLELQHLLAERREQLLVQRQDGAFWMCYKDWVNMFSSFDVCLLPTEFSERKNGPIFPHECQVRGNFEVSYGFCNEQLTREESWERAIFEF